MNWKVNVKFDARKIQIMLTHRCHFETHNCFADFEKWKNKYLQIKILSKYDASIVCNFYLIEK